MNWIFSHIILGFDFCSKLLIDIILDEKITTEFSNFVGYSQNSQGLINRNLAMKSICFRKFFSKISDFQ